MTVWKETSKGVWQHPIGIYEDSYLFFCNPALYNGREYYTLFLTCYVDIVGLANDHDIEARLKEAWKALRFHNPAIAVELRGKDMTYQVPDDKILEDWVAKTYITIDEPGVKPENFVHSLPPVALLPELYYFKHQGAVSCRFSHWRIGFRGMAMIMNRFFRLLVEQPKLQWGTEIENLLPRFEEGLGSLNQDSEKSQNYAAGIFGKVVEGGLSSGLPMKEGKGSAAGISRSMTYVLDENDTAALVAAAKSKGHTVTSVFHAALTQTVFDLAPKEYSGLNQTVGLFRDHRRFNDTPAELKGEDWAVTNPLNGELVVVPPGMSLTELTDFFTRRYRTDFNQKRHLQAFTSYANGFMALLQNMPPEMPPSTMPRLSSVGVVDEMVSQSHAAQGDSKVRVHVKELALSGENPSTETTFWLFTWDGNLRLTTTWNVEYYDEAYVRKLFDHMLGLVGQEMGLELKASVQ